MLRDVCHSCVRSSSPIGLSSIFLLASHPSVIGTLLAAASSARFCIDVVT
jgi:hypothetical protein